jgi:WD40 repeat protein
MQAGLIQRFRRRGWGFFRGEITSLAFAPDSRLALSGSQCYECSDQYLRFWNVPGGRETKRIKSHYGGISGVAISPDGRTALTTNSGYFENDAWVYDSSISVWDLATREEIARFGDDLFLPSTIAFLPDGQRAITGSKDPEERACLRVWELESKRELRRIGEHPSGVSAISVSPCGKYVLTGSNPSRSWPPQTVKLFDVETGSELPFPDYKGAISSVTFAGAGKYAITAGQELIRWDLRDGGKPLRYKRPHGLVHDIAISPDGRYLFTANGDLSAPDAPREDCTVRVFDVEEGTELCTLAGHKSIVKAVACAPDGTTLLSGDEFGEIRHWQVSG